MSSKDTSSDENSPPVNLEDKPPGNGEGTSSNGEKPLANTMNTSSVSEEDSNPQTRKGNMEYLSVRIAGLQFCCWCTVCMHCESTVCKVSNIFFNVRRSLTWM